MNRLALLIGCTLACPIATCLAQTDDAATHRRDVSVVRGQDQHRSIWDFLGVRQVCEATGRLNRVLHSMPLVYHAREKVARPLLTITGLHPGGAPDSFGPPNQPSTPTAAAPTPTTTTPTPAPAPASSGGGAAAAGQQNSPAGAASGAGAPAGAPASASPPPSATDVAKKLAEQTKPANIKVKVKAIRFLGQQNCICYPEVVDALIDALNDCAEPVRYEALLALSQGCSAGFCGSCQAGAGPNGNPACDCCLCQDKVVKRLSTLLLARDINGCLKETSDRVRRQAAYMIHECLHARGFVPSFTEATTEGSTNLPARPDPPLQP